MSNISRAIKTWGKVGALASLGIHVLRAPSLLGSFPGQSALQPVWEISFTPFLILTILFWRARSPRVLIALSVGLLIFLPDFRLARERAIQAEIRSLPIDSKEALPRLHQALERYPANPHLILLLAELEIAQGKNKASFQSLQSVSTWPSELLPRAQHLRYALARGGLTSGAFPEIIFSP